MIAIPLYNPLSLFSSSLLCELCASVVSYKKASSQPGLV